MKWLTASRVTERFTSPKLHLDHKVVTIESIINRVFGAGVAACGARFVDGLGFWSGSVGAQVLDSWELQFSIGSFLKV